MNNTSIMTAYLFIWEIRCRKPFFSILTVTGRPIDLRYVKWEKADDCGGMYGLCSPLSSFPEGKKVYKECCWRTFCTLVGGKSKQ